MTSRRSFLKSLAVLACAPSILVAKSPDAFKWKQTASGVWVMNPAWIDAPYEVYFLVFDDGYRVFIDKSKKAGVSNLPPGSRFVKDPIPMRFKTLEDVYAKLPVSPVIRQA